MPLKAVSVNSDLGNGSFRIEICDSSLSHLLKKACAHGASCTKEDNRHRRIWGIWQACRCRPTIGFMIYLLFPCLPVSCCVLNFLDCTRTEAFHFPFFLPRSHPTHISSLYINNIFFSSCTFFPAFTNDEGVPRNV